VYASLDEFLGSNANDLAKRLGSMSEVVASQIWESVEYNKSNVLELAKRVSIEYPEKQSVGTNASGRNLTCVVTGPLGFGPRPEFQTTFGISYGIKWGSSVSKNTDILVTNETTPTGKFKKAKELQAAGNPIQIMTEEEFLAYIGANGSTAQARLETTQMEVAGLSNYDGSVVDL
jgi:NAD-dependent DNA ligase